MSRILTFLMVLIMAFAPLQVMANESAEAEEGPPGPQFVPVGPLTVPILRDGRIFQYVTVAVKLETKDSADATQITNRLPSLNDAYLSSLYGAFYAGRDMNGSLIDLEKLRTRLASANAKVLPPDIVQNILIQQVSQSSR